MNYTFRDDYCRQQRRRRLWNEFADAALIAAVVAIVLIAYVVAQS